MTVDDLTLAENIRVAVFDVERGSFLRNAAVALLSQAGLHPAPPAVLQRVSETVRQILRIGDPARRRIAIRDAAAAVARIVEEETTQPPPANDAEVDEDEEHDTQSLQAILNAARARRQARKVQP